MTLHRMFHKMRFKPGDVLIVRGFSFTLGERIRQLGREAGIKFGVPIIQVYERADLSKLSFEQIERAYLHAKEVREKGTYVGLRASDPAIQDILLHMREFNVTNPEYTAIKKILEEGADGRYLQKVAESCSADLVVATDTASSSPSTEL